MALNEQSENRGTGVRVRRGRRSDLPQVGLLWEALNQFHTELDWRVPGCRPAGRKKWTDRLGKMLDDPTCRLYVAEADGELVAFATGFLTYAPQVFEPTKTGKVADAYVDSAWRRQGIGRRLLAAMTGWFEQEGVAYLEANMVVSNPVAMSFWRSVGGQAYMMRMTFPVDWESET